MSTGDTKVCSSCAREFAWRKKWERDWERVKYCSEACRRRGVNADDEALERALLDLLGRRSAGASICPSEAARVVGGERWKELMEPARRAARRLAHGGRVVMTQGGRPVAPTGCRGPVRVQWR